MSRKMFDQPGVNFVCDASANADCVGSVSLPPVAWAFEFCAVPLVDVNGLQRRRFVGRWFSDSQSRLRFNVAHAIFNTYTAPWFAHKQRDSLTEHLKQKQQQQQQLKTRQKNLNRSAVSQYLYMFRNPDSNFNNSNNCLRFYLEMLT